MFVFIITFLIKICYYYYKALNKYKNNPNVILGGLEFFIYSPLLPRCPPMALFTNISMKNELILK
jgi:hypothetical protein